MTDLLRLHRSAIGAKSHVAKCGFNHDVSKNGSLHSQCHLARSTSNHDISKNGSLCGHLLTPKLSHDLPYATPIHQFLSTSRTARFAQSRRFEVRAQKDGQGRKSKLSFGDQLLDYIEGGPKLRKWYGQEEQAPRDGNFDGENEPLPEQTYDGPKDAILVTDADSPTGQLIVLSLILARKRVRALVRNAQEAKASFGPYVEPVVGEVKDRESLEKAMGEGVRAVIIPTRVGSTVEVARRLGVEHLVLLSQVGTSKEKDGGGLWGFKSLRGYLDDEASVTGAGIPFTIVRAGKLTDQPGGQSGISLGQGDVLRGSISREDAASICVQALETVPSSSLVFEAVSDKEAAPVEITEALRGLVGAEAVS